MVHLVQVLIHSFIVAVDKLPMASTIKFLVIRTYFSLRVDTAPFKEVWERVQECNAVEWNVEPYSAAFQIHSMHWMLP